MIRNLFLILAVAAAAAPAAAQQGDSARVYELREVDVLPRVENREDFARALARSYPPHLREAAAGGVVNLSFVIGADGTARDVRVLDASDTAFAAPSVQAVSVLRFSPAQVQGRPVAVRLEQPITWQVAADPEPPVAATPPAAPDTDPETFELHAVTEVPRLRNQGEFVRALLRLYPPALRDAGRQGRVRVRFRVERDGSVSRAVVLYASDPAFSAPTLEAVRLLRFSPAKLNGSPVPVWVEQPVNWEVHAAAPTVVPAPSVFGRPPTP